jgi:hypothetical protein
MPYFCPKLLSRPRYLDAPCNVEETQACAISIRRICSSIKSCISPDVQVSSHPRMALTVHASQMKGKRVIAGGYWSPNVALTSLVLKRFPTFMHSGWYLFPQGEKEVPYNSYPISLNRQNVNYPQEWCILHNPRKCSTWSRTHCGARILEGGSIPSSLLVFRERIK